MLAINYLHPFSSHTAVATRHLPRKSTREKFFVRFEGMEDWVLNFRLRGGINLSHHPKLPIPSWYSKAFQQKRWIGKIVKHHYSECATTKCRQSVKSESLQNRQKRSSRGDGWRSGWSEGRVKNECFTSCDKLLFVHRIEWNSEVDLGVCVGEFEGLVAENCCNFFSENFKREFIGKLLSERKEILWYSRNAFQYLILWKIIF